jgi:hypothetical protein
MDAFAAIDHLRNPEVGRNRAQRVGVLRTQAAALLS